MNYSVNKGAQKGSYVGILAFAGAWVEQALVARVPGLSALPTGTIAGAFVAFIAGGVNFVKVKFLKKSA